jgi:hypothetical protein
MSCSWYEKNNNDVFSFVDYEKRDSIDEFMEYNSCILFSLVEKMKQHVDICDFQEGCENAKSLERKQKRKCIVLDFSMETSEFPEQSCEIVSEQADTAVFRNSEPLPETVVSGKKKHGSFKNFLKRVLSLTR